MDETISVLPKLSDNRFKKKVNRTEYSANIADKKIDPDVDSIINQKNSNTFDILNMKHEATEEELSQDNKKTTETQSTSKWNWLIIALAFVVIVLIIVIVWYVLRENTDETKAPPIPGGVMRPSNGLNPHDNNRYQQIMNQQMMCQNKNNLNYRNDNSQSENLPIQTKSMRSKNNTPTKDELESTLKKLETINEDDDNKSVKKLKPKSKKESIKIRESTSDDDEEEDEKLNKKFCDNMKKNVEISDAESDEEESR